MSLRLGDDTRHLVQHRQASQIVRIVGAAHHARVHGLCLRAALAVDDVKLPVRREPARRHLELARGAVGHTRIHERERPEAAELIDWKCQAQVVSGGRGRRRPERIAQIRSR
jgi:hypothetical protein